MSIINLEDTLSAVSNVLSPILQKANVDADNAASAAATQHAADANTIVTLKDQVTNLQAKVAELQAELDAAQNPTPPPPPPPPVKKFVVGVSNGPTATPARFDGYRTYYNNTKIASMLADAEKQMKAGVVPLLSTKPYGTTTTNNWAQIGAGQGDTAWVIPMFDGLEKLCVKYNMPAYLSVHHEPDDEILSGWKASDFVAMQMHLATLSVSRPHVKFGIITMGYHQWEKTDVPMSTVCPPQLAALLDYVGFDPYDKNGQKDWPTYVAKIKNWIKQSGNPDLEFGVMETGTTAATFASHQSWFTKTVGAWKDGGASFWTYWNSQVSSSQNPNPNTDWRMNSAMLSAFNALVDAN